MKIQTLLAVLCTTIAVSLGGSALPSAQAWLPEHLASSAPAGAVAKPKVKAKVCYRSRASEVLVKGITCKRGERVLDAATTWYLNQTGEAGQVNIGKFRCRFPAYLSYIECHHRAAPKKKWAKYLGE